ncbi:metal-dependent php family [Leptolyngbya sp. Heron Island J]|uniref:PHP domain-containing protein n=1 Tax=Leptolyngbya sp. Heron Island J TaxID=1385935 RepID=UPI0003B9CFED|nr:PHP domain-containing protein [Leptolyngbya sp. Heron Island J]ESA35262.1 metal-dependent php family [Leptolyngbya sp. Heron Island J]
MAEPSANSGSRYPTSQAAQELKNIFQQITDQSCPHYYNFHMHTHCSDGKLSPGDLMEQAINLQLKGFAITDHHTIRGYQQACRWLENWRWHHPSTWSAKQSQFKLPRLWCGIEITANLLEVDVHILGYAFNPQHEAFRGYVQGGAPSGDQRQAQAVIQAIQSAGGIAVLAHPVRYRRSPEELIPAAAALGIDGVETYYAYDHPAEWRPTPEKTERVEKLANAYELLSTCGTDSHGLTLTRRI